MLLLKLIGSVITFIVLSHDSLFDFKCFGDHRIYQGNCSFFDLTLKVNIKI